METVQAFFHGFVPMARLAVILFLVLAVPMACKRFALPGAVGLLAAGILIGPHALGVIPEQPVVSNFLADMGKLMLMMFAGVEIDHALFARMWKRSLTFGVFTFSLPFLAGLLAGEAFGYGTTSALLIGSLLASHTLLGFPIVQRLGLAATPPVMVASGATIFTDVASLLVLAVCIPIHQNGFSAKALGVQVLLLLAYVPLVVIGVGRLGKWLLPRFSASEDYQFSLVFLLMILAGFGAEAIDLEPIVGAFMVGMAIGPVAKKAKGFEKFEFLGLYLFIPFFFLNIGFQIDLAVFASTLLHNAALVVSIVGGLILSKYLAAMATRKLYGFNRDEGLLIWSLSLPQVAATLAAALVAYNAVNGAGQRLIDKPVLDTVVVLMVVTSLLGPIMTQRLARRLAQTPSDAA
ncbi:MAG: Kef-type K+ transport system, membrane component [Solidesulfovibrio magneticus str. Maddingley MBC34]|uniref:Kef-type K+ transport system, membrane component n=1 Tax=Solidesulfovibrio magneticus str. Maddingley MBC34 TaxID=1206767 RepID=K6GBA8_9BACT|nr:MAG: Kef-type K+ transport system, membrane component [Solidesulfovibrio magneticus str. Maddingley MBC34]